MSTITVYSKPACQGCKATYKALEKAGIPFETVDITEHPEAREYVESLGYSSVPVIDAGEGLHWAGFRPDSIKKLINN